MSSYLIQMFCVRQDLKSKSEFVNKI